MRRALSALSLFVVVGALGALSQSPALAGPAADPGTDTTAPTVTLDKIPLWTDGYAGRESDPPIRITLSWSGTDGAGPEGPASGIASYDIAQSRERDSSERSFVATTTSTTQQVVDDDLWAYKSCYQVRATDHAGNTGPWSVATCTWLDKWAPSAEGERVYNPVLTTRSSWVKYDNRLDVSDIGIGLNYYLTNERYAGLDGRFGSWGAQRSSSDDRQNVWVRSGQRVCMRDRGVDRLGKGGAWLGSDPDVPLDFPCTTAPWDDSTATARGSVHTIRSGSAWGGSARQLSGSGSLSVPVPAGATQLRVRVQGQHPSGGIAPGSLEVLNNGRRVGTVSTDRSGWFVSSVAPLGSLRPGTLTLRRSAYSRPVVVDAIQLSRNYDIRIE